MTPDFIKNLRVLAFADVLRDQPSEDYALRRIFRWYSEKFHTPLHVVDRLPLADVLQHYYESNAEQMLQDDSGHASLIEELKELLYTEAQLAEAAIKKAAARVEDEAFAAEVEAEARAQAISPEAPVAKRTWNEVSEKGQTSLPGASEGPEIKMTFVDLEELDALAESDSLVPLVGLK